MPEISTLILAADTRQLKTAERDLDRVTGAGERTEKQSGKVAAAMRRVGVAAAAMGAAAAAAALGSVAVGLQRIDAQAKAAASLNTTTQSIQVLNRAAQLSGASFAELEQGSVRLTRRLSLFATNGGGPASEAIEKLGLNAEALMDLPLDERLNSIQQSLADNATEAERAALASQLFGDRAFAAFDRLLSSGAIATATADVEKFGVGVSENAARRVEQANDSISRLGLAFTGMGNQLTAAVAPALGAFAEGAAAAARNMSFLTENIQLVSSFVAAGALVITGSYIPALVKATIATGAWITSLITLRGALLATGIGALVVGAGLLIDQLITLRRATGSWGDALSALGDLAVGVWEGIKTSASSIEPALGAIWRDVQAGFFSMVSNILRRWNEALTAIIVALPANTPEAILGRLTAGARSSAEAFRDFSDSAAEAGKEAQALRLAASLAATQGMDKARAAADRLKATMDGSGEAMTDAADAAKEAAAGINDVETAAAGSGGSGGASGAMQEAEQELDRLNTGFTRTPPIIDDVARAFGDFLARGLRDFDGFVDSVLNGFKNMLSQMIATAARNQLLIGVGLAGGGAGGAASAGGLGGGLGGGGGLLGSITGGLGGIGGALAGGFMNSATALFGAGGGLGSLATSIGAQIGAATTGSLTAIAGAVGAVALPVAAIAGAVSLLSEKTKIVDRGIRVLTNDTDTLIRTFKDKEKSRLGGLISSNKTTFRTIESAGGPITDAVQQAQQEVRQYADVLGVAGDAFKDFSADVSISLKNVTEKEIPVAIENMVKGIRDDFAEEAVKAFPAVVRDGGSAAGALMETAKSLALVNDRFKALNFTLMDVSLQGGLTARNLIDTFGGFEQFAQATGTYIDRFFSDAEKLDLATRRLGDAFSDLGVGFPKTKKAFRALVEDVEKAGQKDLLAGLLGLSGSFADFIDAQKALSEAQKALSEATIRETDELRKRKAELEAQLSGQDAVRSLELSRLQSDAARSLQSDIFALTDALAAQAEATRLAEAAATEIDRLSVALLRAKGETEQLRALDLAGLLSDQAREMQRQIWAIEAKAEAEAEARKKAEAAATEVGRLSRSLLEAKGATEELRRLDLAGLLSDQARAIQSQIWAIEAKAEAEAEAQRQAAEVASEIDGLSRSLLEAQGETEKLRALDLAGLLSDQARQIQKQIWAIQDAAEAQRAYNETLESGRRALQSAVDAERRVVESRLRSLENERDSLQSQIDNVRVRDVLSDGLQLAEKLAKAALDVMRINERSVEIQREAALRQLRTMLQIGRIDADRIDGLISSASNFGNTFATETDFLRAQVSTANTLVALSDLQEKLAREAQEEEERRAAAERAMLQRQLSAVEDQIALAEMELERLDLILEDFGLLNENVLSVDAAVKNLQMVLDGSIKNVGGQVANLASAIANMPPPQVTVNVSAASATATSPAVPGFAGGGNHLGGLRVVGERGPELEATGPSRIFNARQTKEIVNGGGMDKETKADIRALMEYTRELVKINNKQARSLREIEFQGETT